MSSRGGRSSYGYVFDALAEDYDRERPTYPEELVSRAVELGGLRPGDPVLESGCGTGQLTQSLVARGLRVTAVEPGANMIRVARRKFADGEVRFLNARFEDAPIEEAGYQALFSATAFHWVDPDVGWRRAAGALREGGRLALIQYRGVIDERSAAAHAAFEEVLERIAPELAAELGPSLSADDVVSGARDRAGNVSEVWTWVTEHQLANPSAAELFEEATVEAIPIELERTPEQMERQFRTTSMAYRLGAERVDQLVAANRALAEESGGMIRFTDLAVLVTARRR